MHPVANTLVQLQELLLIRDESKISSGSTKLDKLDKSVEAMSAELPHETCVLFKKLHKKDPSFIVPGLI